MATPRVDVVIGAKTEQFGAGVKGVVSQLNNLGREFQIGPLGRVGEFLVNPLTAATAAASALVGTIAKSVAYAERLQTIAAKVGTTVGKAGAIARAEDVTGAPAGSVERLVGKLQRSIGEALTGSRAMQDAFDELKINQEGLVSGDAVDMFEKIIKRFESGSASAREYAAANKVLGESFGEILPFLRRGLGSEMGKSSWLDLSPAEAASSERLGQERRSLWQSIGGGMAKVGAGLSLGFAGLGRHLRIGGWLARAAINDNRAWDQIVDLQVQDMEAHGTYTAGDLRAAEQRLLQHQQRRQLLESMRSSNRLGMLGMEFDALSAAEQLRYLGDLQSGAVQSLSRQSPFEQEGTIQALLRVLEDSRKLQAKMAEELSKTREDVGRGVNSLEGL